MSDREVTFVSEADFDADPDRWINAAGPNNKVAVYDEDDNVVMMMGGTYTIPDGGRAERQVAAVRKVLRDIENDANDYRLPIHARNACVGAASALRCALEVE